MFAAKQHFAAVQSGYKSESLRNEKKKLLEDNQRLALEIEKESAPQSLEPKARQLGLQPATAGQIVVKPTTKSVETKPQAKTKARDAAKSR